MEITEKLKKAYDFAMFHFDTPKKSFRESFIKAAVQSGAGVVIGGGLSEISKAADILVVDFESQTLIVMLIGAIGGVINSVRQDRKGEPTPAGM